MKTAWVFSGGGAAGIRHVAALRAAVTMGIPVDFVVGTSAGALCAAGFCWAGINELEDMWFSIKSEADIFRSRYWVEFLWSMGLKTSAPLKQKVEKLYDKRGASITPFQVVCTDLVSQMPIYFDNSHPDIVNRVVASASIPILVEPYAAQKSSQKDVYRELLVDGGAVENCPLQGALNQKPDQIIISHCFPRNRIDREVKVKGIRDVIGRTIQTMTTESYKEDMEVCETQNEMPILNLMPTKATIDTLDFEPQKIRDAYQETLDYVTPLLRAHLKP